MNINILRKCLEDQDRANDPYANMSTFQIAKMLMLVGFKMFVSIRPVCRRRMMMDNVIVLSQSLKCFPVVAMCHTEITLVGEGHSYDPQEVPNGRLKSVPLGNPFKNTTWI